MVNYCLASTFINVLGFQICLEMISLYFFRLRLLCPPHHGAQREYQSIFRHSDIYSLMKYQYHFNSRQPRDAYQK